MFFNEVLKYLERSQQNVHCTTSKVYQFVEQIIIWNGSEL